MFFEDIKAFIAVAENKSFSRAANYLGVAQSALSKRVQRLEDQIGVSLLHRHARGVTLSQHGYALLNKARRLVLEIQMLEKNLIEVEDLVSGTVSIALPQRTAGFLVPKIIKQCSKKYPKIKIEIMEGNTSDVHSWIMKECVDIAITYSGDEIRQSNQQKVFEEPLYLFVTPFFIKNFFEDYPSSIRLSDLEKIPLILPKRPNPIRILVDKIVVARNLKLNIVYEIDGFSSICGMVRDEFGGTIFGMNSTWNSLVKDGDFLAIPFTSPSMKWMMYLVRSRAGIDSMATTKVYDLVFDELKNLIDEGVWPYARLTMNDGVR